MVVAGILALLNRIAPTAVSQGPAGTATRNYLAEDREGGRWFVKAYPRGTNMDMDRERQALALGEAARRAGVSVPAVRRTVTGEMIASAGGLSVSVTQYIADAETAEGGLSGGRWAAVGETVGRLHRALASHPVGPPHPVVARAVCDVARARRRLEELLARCAAAPPPRGGFAAWCARTAEQRRAALPEVAARLEKLPATLMTQVVHGDLASPNLLLRGEAVAAVIDFRPPSHRSAAWEFGRIVLDRAPSWPARTNGSRAWPAPLTPTRRHPPRLAARGRLVPGLLGLSPVRTTERSRRGHPGAGGVRACAARGRRRAVGAPGRSEEALRDVLC